MCRCPYRPEPSVVRDGPLPGGGALQPPVQPLWMDLHQRQRPHQDRHAFAQGAVVRSGGTQDGCPFRFHRFKLNCGQSSTNLRTESISLQDPDPDPGLTFDPFSARYTAALPLLLLLLFFCSRRLFLRELWEKSQEKEQSSISRRRHPVVLLTFHRLHHRTVPERSVINTAPEYIYLHSLSFFLLAAVTTPGNSSLEEISTCQKVVQKSLHPSSLPASLIAAQGYVPANFL